MKKSQKTFKPSAKGSKLPAKKTATAPPKTAQKKAVTKSEPKKTAAKPVASKSTTRKKALPGPEKTNITAEGKVPPKKPQKVQTEIRTRPSKLKTAAKPAAVKSTAKKKALPGPEKANKTAKGKVPPKTPQKASDKATKAMKTAAAKQEKPLRDGKARIAEKKPARRSPVKRVPAKPAKTKKETTTRAVPIKPLTGKSVKVSAGKKEVKKAKVRTVAAETKITAIKKKDSIKISKPGRAEATLAKTAGSVGTKGPSVRKSSKVASVEKEETTVKKRGVSARAEKKIAGEKSLAETPKAVSKKKPLAAKAPLHIKEKVKEKAEIKPKEKPIATLKTAPKKGAGPSTLSSAGPSRPAGEKTDALPASTLQPEKKAGKASKLRIFLPEEELPPEETPIAKAPSPKLPEEYGENELLLMEVDPSIVFVSWEIRPDDIARKTDKLTLRVYDVTGLDFDGSNANKFFDIALCSRVNSKFIDIKMPGRDVVMEVGLLNAQGGFLAIKRSNRVSMPALQAFDEFGFTGPLPGPDTLVGY